MDIFRLDKSKTRQKLLKIFLDNQGRKFYLRELERKIGFSVGNIRRELNNLVSLGLFEKEEKNGRVYYGLKSDSKLYKLMVEQLEKDIVKSAVSWAYSSKPAVADEQWYCPSRDIFAARLEILTSSLEKSVGTDAYLLGAIAGEIGNNSFDHNLGRWPDIPGIFFAYESKRRIIVLSDRGVGIFQTIKAVKPETKNDIQALKIAFTKIISGRKYEHRGNGLKFVRKVIKEKKWQLEFTSGRAKLLLKPNLVIIKSKRSLQGTLVIVRY